jgi:hypothetical protein
VAGGETALKQLFKVDLTASCGKRQEIQVMNVNVAFSMGLGMIGMGTNIS